MAVSLKALLENTQLLYPNQVEDQTCPICFDDYLQDQSRELPRKLPCGHVIGTECLLQWASAQNGTAAIKCPRCTLPIIDPPGAKQLLAVIIALAGTMAEQAEARMERSLAAIYLVFEEQQIGVVVATTLLTVLGAYFDTAFAWSPLCILYWCATLTTKHRLVGHRRLGLLFLGVGLCVGEFVQQDLGHDLFGFGRMAYRDSILRIYSDHPWLVLGCTFGIYIMLPALRYPVGGMIESEVELHLVGCTLSIILTWMVESKLEDCRREKVELYIEGNADYFKEVYEARAGVEESLGPKLA